jgi:hypothetical protein
MWPVIIGKIKAVSLHHADTEGEKKYNSYSLISALDGGE